MYLHHLILVKPKHVNFISNSKFYIFLTVLLKSSAFCEFNLLRDISLLQLNFLIPVGGNFVLKTFIWLPPED